MKGWIELLNKSVLGKYDTCLVGGFPEPFYKAPGPATPAEVQFTRDYERSALHELGHWCIAGRQRRLLDDYDYWYIPDGRSNEQQRIFFDVEVRPQALEKYFCSALELRFEVSMDNLGQLSPEGAAEFSERVDRQYRSYRTEGFPARAAEIFNCLRQWKTGEPE